MSTLTVWKFPDAGGAQEALQTLDRLQSQQLITVLDGAVVSWPLGAKKPKTHQLNDRTGHGALGGAFWGLLFGMIFFVPLIGLAIGAAAGALGGSLADAGISDEFIREVKEKVTPGTSALFLLSANAVLDKVVPEVEDLKGELIHTNLTDEQEQALHAAFDED
ncbi:MAG TPA: DUF1269 domain-containing protein [Actinocrinis sp.]|nr:DUF1269 domain-containing protein [Actinocrinis sp.]